MELKARLLAGRRIVDLHEQLLVADEFLRFAATHDPLTGLWNRGEIISFLRRELARADREHRPLGIVLGDVDHFKNLNDTFGHIAGDSIGDRKTVAGPVCGYMTASGDMAARSSYS